MNVLIIGLGVAGKFYLKLFKNMKINKKIFLFDPFKKNNNKFYLDKISKEILKKNKIKYAIIATPSYLHYKYAKLLIQNNINLLIEKPFVLNLSNAKNLIQLHKSKKSKCWVVFQNRFNLAIQYLKKNYVKKNIKDIFFVDAKMFWNRDIKYYKSGWHGKYKTDGGVLTNQAIHTLDAIVYLFGKVKKFNSFLMFNKSKLEAEDFVLLNLHHANKVLTSLKATTRADKNYENEIDIISKKNRFKVSGISLNLFQRFKKNQIITDKTRSEIFSNKKGVLGAMGNGHKKILKEFLNDKVSKSSKDLEISKNLHILEIIHSVYNVSKKNQLLRIKSKQSILGKNEK